ncbi:hypothetical protein Sjap_006711 [Stephania japonica]|uniref:Uncharacterized protein n=1 Tax=Stephania japonica TaxID=461633 RepID=A0AAP0K806_9MAGN
MSTCLRSLCFVGPFSNSVRVWASSWLTPTSCGLSSLHPTHFGDTSGLPHSLHPQPPPPPSSPSPLTSPSSPSLHHPFTLSLLPTPTPPPPPPPLLVRSAVLPTGKALPHHLLRLFSPPPPPPTAASSPTPPSPSSSPAPLLPPPPPTSSSSSSDLTLFSRSISTCPPPDLTSLLFSAVRSSPSPDPRFTRQLITSGADVNGSDGKESLVSAAVGAGGVGVLTVLIESGCEINGGDLLLMHRAVEMGRLDVMRLLGRGGCGWDSVDDSNGRSPVHVAATLGRFEALKLCVSMGGDPDRVDFNGYSPLHCAAEHGDLDCVDFLLNCAVYSKNSMTSDGRTPFSCAMDNGHWHLMELLRLGDVLSRAARVGDGVGLESCISQGGNVNGRDQNGWTPLHRAAFKGEIAIVKSLVGHGAKIDLVDDVGYTALHCAVEAGRVEVAAYLIAQGAQQNLKSFKDLMKLSEPIFLLEGRNQSIESNGPWSLQRIYDGSVTKPRHWLYIVLKVLALLADRCAPTKGSTTSGFSRESDREKYQGIEGIGPRFDLWNEECVQSLVAWRLPESKTKQDLE